jgi:L-asparagine transporter-like permease
MKKLNPNHLKRVYRFSLVLAIIILLIFIVLTWRRELEFPVIPTLLPIFIITVIMLSKRAKRKKEEEDASKEE